MLFLTLGLSWGHLLKQCWESSMILDIISKSVPAGTFIHPKATERTRSGEYVPGPVGLSPLLVNRGVEDLSAVTAFPLFRM